MSIEAWKKRLQAWRGESPIEEDLSPFHLVLEEIRSLEPALARATDTQLRQQAASLVERGRAGSPRERLLPEVFALVREAAERLLAMRPFDVQVLASIALQHGKLIEMQTGEGKTLTAILPACLAALAGRGVHVLTFNDYLARRDAAWMGPVYAFLGLQVGVIQEGMTLEARRQAYAADVTYATAKEAGFDFLRMHLAREPSQMVHRPFHEAIVDEADSILIDEARVPLVIAGDRPRSPTSPERLAALVAALEKREDWETDAYGRNVFLTENGTNRVERELGCGNLHAPHNYLLLTEVNHALHAQVLLRRDVDYIVRDSRIELVDAFTGRVVVDRRWPDGLQAALEAKEGLPIQPGGRILGSIALQHFLAHYPRLSGMTATARPASRELEDFYGLRLVPIPPHRPCIRQDLPDLVFTHAAAKHEALVESIAAAHGKGRPVLVGTTSVKESELLSRQLQQANVECLVLNAKNDEAEAAIIARAGTRGAVTISTNMAGRGTDIKLGGDDPVQRQEVIDLGGLLVIGTNRHESRRIDDQLRGRAGRQGDPGTSRLFVSLEDDLMLRFGINDLIPSRLRPPPRPEPLDHPVVRREVERLQRIVEAQNYEIRKTLWRYSSRVEKQRQSIQDWRLQVLLGHADPGLRAQWAADRLQEHPLGDDSLAQIERAVLLHHIDHGWAEHLALITHVQDGIHLVALGGMDPLVEFNRQVGEAFLDLRPSIEARAVETLRCIEITAAGADLESAGIRGASSTWTYLVNDQALSGLQQLLLGPGNVAFAGGAALTTWPLLIGWEMWQRLSKGKN